MKNNMMNGITFYTGAITPPSKESFSPTSFGEVHEKTQDALHKSPVLQLTSIATRCRYVA